MKTFDLKAVEIEKMSDSEQNELLDYIISLDLVEIYEYIFFLLNEKYTLSDTSETNRKYELFLANPKFTPYRNSIMNVVSMDEEDEKENITESFPSKKDYLAANIGYLKSFIGDDRTIYEEESKKLKELEAEYNTINQ